MLRQTYDLVMNDDENAFSNLPKTTRFQMMTVLSFIWSVAFTVSIGKALIYSIEDERLIVYVVKVGHRRDVYR